MIEFPKPTHIDMAFGESFSAYSLQDLKKQAELASESLSDTVQQAGKLGIQLQASKNAMEDLAKTLAKAVHASGFFKKNQL